MLVVIHLAHNRKIRESVFFRDILIKCTVISRIIHDRAEPSLLVFRRDTSDDLALVHFHDAIHFTAFDHVKRIERNSS